MNTHKITENYFIDSSKIISSEKWTEISEKIWKSFINNLAYDRGFFEFLARVNSVIFTFPSAVFPFCGFYEVLRFLLISMSYVN